MANEFDNYSADILDFEADEFEGNYAEFIRKVKSCNKGVLRKQRGCRTSTPKQSAPNKDLKGTKSSCSLKVAGEPLTPKENVAYPELHKLIFDADYETIKRGFDEGAYNSKLFAKLNGNSPLFTAVMVCIPNETNVRRYKIIDLLFKMGGDPLEKNDEGWSLLEVAASIKNTYIVNMVYKHTRAAKLRLWREKQEVVVEHLAYLPDFYLEIKWDFRSSLIPFLSHFTPSDTFKIWKMGSSIRLDFSFLGYNEGAAIVSDTTLLMREKFLIRDQYHKVELAVLDKKNRALVNPLDSPDDDEIKESVKEIISNRVVQGDIKIGEVGWKSSKTILGNNKVKKIYGRLAQKYKVNFDMEVNTKVLDNCLIEESYEEYIKKITKSKESITTQKVNCGLWISEDFPLKLSQLRVIVKTLAKHNNSFKKLEEYLGNDTIQSILVTYGFPVRIQIPMGHFIYAVVTFTEFKFLEPDFDTYTKTFSIPEGYKLLKRKEMFCNEANNKNKILSNLNI